MAVGRRGKVAYHAAIGQRDRERNVPIGEGVVPYEAYFKLVRELAVHGPASVHFEFPPFERSPISEAEKRAKFPELMRKDLAALKAAMAKAGVS